MKHLAKMLFELQNIGITLQSGAGSEQKPLAFPHHSINTYLPKLLKH
jgi:hypothetical protein